MAQANTTADVRGNLIGYLNKSKQPGDDRPVFQGKLSLPGLTTERGFALWAHTSEKTGDTVLSGRAGESATSQIEKLTKPPRQHDTDTTIKLEQRDGSAGLSIDPHSMLLFTNKQKDTNQARPDYWGYYNPGGGQPLMRLAAWAKTDRHGSAMLTGSLQKEEPKRENAPDNGPPDNHQRHAAEPEREYDPEPDHDDDQRDR